MIGDHLHFEVLGHAEPAGSKTNMPRRRFPVTLHSMRDFLAAFPLVDANPKSKGWKEKVAQAASAAMLRDRRELMEGPLFVQITVRRARPKGHFRKDGVTLSLDGMRSEHPTSKPDVLKYARGIEDACTGIVWKDDAQIVKEPLCKEWCRPGQPEGISVTVVEL